MRQKTAKRYSAFVLAAVAVSVTACGDSTPPEPMFQNPSTIRVVNRLNGPILTMQVRACGTSAWGGDLFGTTHPVDGTIQPGSERDFTVEGGCYDLRATHLETTEPGPLIEKIVHDQVASPVTPVVWTLDAGPVTPF